MPQVTVYIRKEDMDKWKNLANKSAVISFMLNNQRKLPSVNELDLPKEWGEVRGVPRASAESIPMAYDGEKRTVLGKPVEDVVETTDDEVNYEPFAD